MGNLQKLLFCQNALARLSFHTERLLQHGSSVASKPVRPRARQLNRLSENDWRDMGEPRSVQENIKQWENNLINPEGGIFPPLHLQSENIHWQKILQEAQAIEDAVRRLTRTADFTPEDIARIQHEHNMAQAFNEERPSPYRGEVWTFRALHRDIEWLLPLIRSVATICQIMGDFGHEREGHSAAGVAYISEQLAQCATDLEQDASFFSFYATRFTKSRLAKDQAQMLKDVVLIQHAAKDLAQRRISERRSYTPPMIAEIMDLSPDTIIRCIEEMEGRFTVRTRKEIKSKEEEMKKAGEDPLIYKTTYDTNIRNIKKEGAGELKPRNRTEKGRRAYSWKQVVEISIYYDTQPSRWTTRKPRGQRLPESPE